MNRKLTTRVVRWLAIISSSACAGGISLQFNTIYAQDSSQPAPQATYQWRVDENSVHQAMANEMTPNRNVMYAAGAVLPPILTPEQAKPSSNSSMLAPIVEREEASRWQFEPMEPQYHMVQPAYPAYPIEQNSPVQPAFMDNSLSPDTRVEQAQWPAVNRQDSYSRAAWGSGSRNLPAQVQDNAVQVFPMENSPGSLPPIVTGNNDLSNALPQEMMPAETNIPPSSTLVPPPSTYQTPNLPTAPTYQPGNALPSNQSYFDVDRGEETQFCPTPDPSCFACGPNGCNDQAEFDSRFGCCGSVSAARSYVVVDALYLNRSDAESFTGINLGNLGTFDSTGGVQATIGRRLDATEGREITYLGTQKMKRARTVTSASNSLNANFNVGGNFGAREVGSFFSASRQTELQSTLLQSLEFNRTKWSWDVFKGFIGLRGIFVEDFYGLLSVNDTSGLLTVDTRNNMIGPQIGAEFFYDVGYRLSLSGVYKGGAYINFTDLDDVLVNNNTVFINSQYDKTTLSYSLDFQQILHYQLSPQFRFRFGAGISWLFGMTTANDNFPAVVSGSLGNSSDNDDEMRFVGIFGGFEYYR